MRLLVVTQYFWPENFRVNDLVLELGKRGHDVTVLTGKPNYPLGAVFPEYLKDPENFSSFEGAKVVRVPMVSQGRGAVMRILNYLSFALSASLLGALRLRGEKFDAVFVFQPSPATVGFPALVMSRIKKAPVAIWVLDQWPETLEAVGVVKSKRVLRFLGKLISGLYNRCGVVLVQSKRLVTLIREKYIEDGEKVHYFPNWAENVFAGTLESAAPEVPVREGSFNVMFAGNMGESQDFPAILEAAEKLREYEHIRWLIVGDGRVSEWVREEVARRRLEERFILLGRHPLERMPSFYRHADALLVSLRPEPVFAMTLPGKVQSYFAAGVPVVGMLDGEGADIIDEADAGIACPAGDAGALAKAVLKLYEMDESGRRRYGENGRSYSSEKFDRETQIGTLERHLSMLASGR